AAMPPPACAGGFRKAFCIARERGSLGQQAEVAERWIDANNTRTGSIAEFVGRQLGFAVRQL
ncbi:MAG: hypothetical protein ACUVQK_10335, partial [Thermogutta sp.]